MAPGQWPAVCRVLRLYTNLLYKRRPAFVVVCLITALAIYIYVTQEPLRKTIKVYVVEEHHEVLRFWYHETVLHSFNDTGNTLIHIDAHADLAAPSTFPEFPFFHWPRDETQVFNMMQRNDMFIQAAASTGLINHIIWIWPSWDASQQPPYEAFELGLGVIAKTVNTSRTFCECQTPLDKNGEKIVSQKDCSFLEMTDTKPPHDVHIEAATCRVLKSILVEFVRDDEALRILQEEGWPKAPSSILLDIDEDYFGCESGFDVLSEAQISWPVVLSINEKLVNMICPFGILHEELADTVIKDYIVEFIKLCQLKDPEDYCAKDVNHLRMVLDKHIMESYEEEHTMYCTDTATEALFLMADLLSIFHGMSLRSLNALLRVGFCLNTSPATLGFSEGLSELKLCHGVNTPNDTIVSMYTPEVPEVFRRMNDLHDMLGAIKKLDPKVVTVCRSVRDGYTPRSLAHLIEEGVLDFFKDSNIDDERVKFDILFDDNLLGGVNGWEGRYMYDKFNV